MKSETYLPKVSVIMNCLNGERYLREALDSVYNQTYKNWEIIFWDNASVDKSVEIAESYDDQIRIFKSKVTSLLGKARNLALQESSGELIAFLDCDDVWEPTKLEKQISLFKEDPKLGLVFSDYFLFTDDRTICQMYQKFRPPRGQIFESLLNKYFLGILSVVIRKSAVQCGKGFDDRLSILEDFDLFHRIAYENKADYIDEPLAKYRVHSQSVTFKDYSKIAQERELLLKKWVEVFPNIIEEFPKGFDVFNNKTIQHKAIGKWVDGFSGEARKIFGSISDPGFVVYSLYMLTYFPPSLLFPLVKLNHFLKNWFDWSHQ